MMPIGRDPDRKPAAPAHASAAIANGSSAGGRMNMHKGAITAPRGSSRLEVEDIAQNGAQKGHVAQGSFVLWKRVDEQRALALRALWKDDPGRSGRQGCAAVVQCGDAEEDRNPGGEIVHHGGGGVRFADRREGQAVQADGDPVALRPAGAARLAAVGRPAPAEVDAGGPGGAREKARRRFG